MKIKDVRVGDILFEVSQAATNRAWFVTNLHDRGIDAIYASKARRSGCFEVRYVTSMFSPIAGWSPEVELSPEFIVIRSDDAAS